MNCYFYVYVFVTIHLSWFFWLPLFQRAESRPSSKTFQTSIDDSENISDYENLKVTSAPKEKSKPPKDLCFTDEATELSIV